MNSVISNNNTVTNSVTPVIKNSHCIVCGNAFNAIRAGKLYCSNKCKQYGYNHKDTISNILPSAIAGINQKQQSFYIDEYSQYDRSCKKVKRYKDLKKKEAERNSKSNEIKLRQNIGLNVSDYIWNSFIGNQLTDEEESEMYDIENELSDEILPLILKEYTLEQWSFLKSLYPDLDEIAFYKTISSLGREFLGELNLRPLDLKESKEHSIIKIKFINHCNLIAEGKVTFIQKPISHDEENQD